MKRENVKNAADEENDNQVKKEDGVGAGVNGVKKEEEKDDDDGNFDSDSDDDIPMAPATMMFAKAAGPQSGAR